MSIFYGPFGVDAGASLAAFFSSISNRFPNSLTWSAPTSGDTVEDTTGLITGAWTGGTAVNQTGSGGAGAYAAGVGVAVTWETDKIIGRRRLRGRTFLCPLLASEFQTDGTITAACLTTLNAAATTLVATNDVVIWHRPSSGGSDGDSDPAVGHSIADRVTALRSRRF